MTDAERYGWNKSAIRLAADIAAEKGVTIRLERDGSITLSPVQADAVAEMRAFIESKKDPEGW